MQRRIAPFVAERRLAIRCAYANGFLWALGAGLTSISLVIYLALELGAVGIAISLILACPQLVGVSRLAAPQLIGWVGDQPPCYFT